MYAYLKIKETENTLILDKKIDVNWGLFQNNFFLFSDSNKNKEVKTHFLTEKDLEGLEWYKNIVKDETNHDPYFSILDWKSFSELKVKLPKRKSLTKSIDEENEKEQERIKAELVWELLNNNVDIEQHISIFNNWTHKINKKRTIDYYNGLSNNPVIKYIKENINSILFRNYIGKQFSINKNIIEKIFDDYALDFSLLFQLLNNNNDIDFKNMDFFMYGYLNSFWPWYNELLEKAITPDIHNKISYWLSKRSISEKSAFYYLYKKWFVYAFTISAYNHFVEKYGKDSTQTRCLLNLLTIIFSTTEGKKYKEAYIKDTALFKSLQNFFFKEKQLDVNNFLIIFILSFL